MDQLAEHFSLLVVMVTAVGGAAAWYGAAVKKSYASERDFTHLKNNYKSLASNVAALDRMLDQRLDTLQRENAELKTLLQGALIRMGFRDLPEYREHD